MPCLFHWNEIIDEAVRQLAVAYSILLFQFTRFSYPNELSDHRSAEVPAEDG